MTVVPQGGGSVSRAGGGSSSLYDVLELILDRGLVIDVFVRVSLVGIEILKIDARIVVASVDTYLRFAEACNRLDLESGGKAPAKLTDIVGDSVESGARGKSKGALTGAVEAVTDSLKGGQQDDDADEEQEDEEAEDDAREPRRRKEREPAERRRRTPTRRTPRRAKEREEE
ncbi:MULTISPECIES: gas vesicle structural protein GvpA [Streptomyces]|uniref:Gas vesicle structural protein GvpA n=1 Tax=Streptomyces pratisoli TaxID=3139917 RepID=A0ACC6QUW0_9ACTN|nr:MULTISPECIES: gas vesicle structural protein GvpA [unclassified Streptomyces]MCX4513828.1 gas vesicle structural protein GvpA [Streptomyces sp. NBC_01619]